MDKHSASSGGIISQFIPLGFASGIIPNPDISRLDNSVYKFQCATLLKFEPHYDHQISVHFVSEIWVSLKLICNIFQNYVLKFIHKRKIIINKERQIMTEIKNVTVVKEANVYFEGKVTSRTVLFPDGSRKTLGIMIPGDYEFGTTSKEIMEILAGDLDVLLPGKNKWLTFKAGESFEVSAQSKFRLKVKTVTDYCCSYIS
jgi:purine/pyrimidine-nucleoside phosphorylase